MHLANYSNNIIFNADLSFLKIKSIYIKSLKFVIDSPLAYRM